MRLIGLLLALLAVGWLVMTQLKGTPATAVSGQDGANTAVQVPRNAEEMKAFEARVNSLADEQNAKTQEALDRIQ